MFRGSQAGTAPQFGEYTPAFDSATYESLFCADPDSSYDVNLKGVPLVIPPGSGAARHTHTAGPRVAVLVTDKYGELVRNATVNPNSYAESVYPSQRDKDYFSHNYAACNAPNQWFTGTSGLDATLRVGGWVHWADRWDDGLERSGIESRLPARSTPLPISPSFAQLSVPVLHR